jgi:hypothetical protein
MLAHSLGFLILLGSALLVVLGAGVCVFALARGDRRLAGRAAIATLGYSALYLLGTAMFTFLAPRRVVPIGGEISFCGIDCHLHVSVIGSETDMDRVGVRVRVRSNARREPEYPGYLQFRLTGTDGVLLVPENEARAFTRPVAAGQAYVDSLYFTVSPTAFPYTLRVIYPGPINALLFGPASSWATGKTTLAIGETQP